MSFTYDKEFIEGLRKSKEIGYLQNCVIDKETGRVLVGMHRKFADPNWPECPIEVKDELHRLLIMVNGNYHRKIPEDETRGLLLKIARILEERGVPKAGVCTEMSKLPIPYSEQHVRKLLPKEYKMMSQARPQRKLAKTVSPTRPIKTALETVGERTFPFPDCTCRECPHRQTCW